MRVKDVLRFLPILFQLLKRPIRTSSRKPLQMSRLSIPTETYRPQSVTWKFENTVYNSTGFLLHGTDVPDSRNSPENIHNTKEQKAITKQEKKSILHATPVLTLQSPAGIKMQLRLSQNSPLIITFSNSKSFCKILILLGQGSFQFYVLAYIICTHPVTYIYLQIKRILKTSTGVGK